MKEFKKKLDLCLAKLEKEVDYEWAEIVRLCGLNIHPDNLRKMAYGYREYNNYIEACKFGDVNADNIDLLNEKLLEIQKAKVLLADQKKLVNEKIRNLSRTENFVDLLKENIDNLNDNYPLIVEKKDFIKKENVGVLLLSDIHFGIESDNLVNQYNPDIAIKRFSELVTKTLSHCKRHNINELYVYELGDTLSGLIHSTIRFQNRLEVTEQIVGIANLLSQCLYMFSNALNKVTFTMVEGNHDRIIDNKKNNLNKDSFTTLVQELIIERTKAIENLKIVKTNAETYSLLNIKGYNCVGVHGDKDKPNDVVENMIAITNVVPDFVYMGHYHNANEITNNNTEIIINGSFSGVDEYAYNLRKASPPVQKFIVMNDFGRECTYNIRLN